MLYYSVPLYVTLPPGPLSLLADLAMPFASTIAFLNPLLMAMADRIGIMCNMCMHVYVVVFPMCIAVCPFVLVEHSFFGGLYCPASIILWLALACCMRMPVAFAVSVHFVLHGIRALQLSSLFLCAFA